MTPKEFFDKVVLMRRLQKEVKITRFPPLLKQCQKVETIIDDEIKRVEKIIDNQNTLFQ